MKRCSHCQTSLCVPLNMEHMAPKTSEGQVLAKALETHTLLVRVQIATSIMEKSLAFSTDLKNLHNLPSNKFIPGGMSNKIAEMNVSKDMYGFFIMVSFIIVLCKRWIQRIQTV